VSRYKRPLINPSVKYLLAQTQFLPCPISLSRVTLNAKLPTRNPAFAAGYDLYSTVSKQNLAFSVLISCVYSTERKVIPAHGKALIDTQLSIAVPPGTYGRVAPRSGLGEFFPDIDDMRGFHLVSKFKIDTGAGVTNADYRGILFVLLFSHSDIDFTGTW